jgi:two-component system, chemotaxis family, sensor histidine kinase and response regulator WspE
MSQMNLESLSELSMLELFRMEVATQTVAMTEGLLAVERDADPAPRLRELMRAAHSLKGAARIVGRTAAVRISHAIEDCLVAVQARNRSLSQELIDTLLQAVDVLGSIAQASDEGIERWEDEQKQAMDALVLSLSSSGENLLAAVAAEGGRASSPRAIHPEGDLSRSGSGREPGEQSEVSRNQAAASDRVLRVTADNLDRLMALAGEALVTSRWLNSFATNALRLKQLHYELGQTLEGLCDLLPVAALNERARGQLVSARDRLAGCQLWQAGRLTDLDLFDRRFVSFSRRLYHEVLDCRMRPFADGVQGFPRMVRDVANSLGKTVRLEMTGESTPVDRDILERLKPTLDHLLRNAIDHGVEDPAGRRLLGKSEEATLQLQACHSAGMLLVTVADDGCGIDPEDIRKAVVEKKLTALETSQKMTAAELLEFLFLPGFTLKESVSEISGRGIGLDIVRTMVREVGGRVRISSRCSRGTRFQLELPLTLSVIRTLLVEIGGEPYAFPLARIDKVLKLPTERIESVEGRQHFTLDEEQIGLVAAHQVLEVDGTSTSKSEVSLIVLGEKTARYGLVVDRFLGARELVVRPLDSRLGKVRNISSAALMPDGSPVLVIDVDDLNRSIANLTSAKRLSRVGSGAEELKKRKRVLVVDDSLTVRELVRKLLESADYLVDATVDGADGWNAVRTGHYDLVVTDVDMPRLDGIELLKLIRNDSRLKSLPVMIVSYKDRQEDRSRGLEAGADYYLTKASFQDETLIRVVADLIGGSDS